jgi:hypothetical protein
MWFGQNPALRLAAAVKMDGAGLEIPKTVFFADENDRARDTGAEGRRQQAEESGQVANEHGDTEALDIRQTNPNILRHAK